MHAFLLVYVHTLKRFLGDYFSARDDVFKFLKFQIQVITL